MHCPPVLKPRYELLHRGVYVLAYIIFIQIKYGVKASSGGGRSSARETIGRVAAGAIAEKFLLEVCLPKAFFQLFF
jgi:hypothetical protein